MGYLNKMRAKRANKFGFWNKGWPVERAVNVGHLSRLEKRGFDKVSRARTKLTASRPNLPILQGEAATPPCGVTRVGKVVRLFFFIILLGEYIIHNSQACTLRIKETVGRADMLKD